MADAGSTLPRRQLGKLLLEWRTRAGLTQVKAAELLEIGQSSVQRLEKGENSRLRSGTIRDACELYGVPKELAEGMIGLAKQANVKNWWNQYSDVIAKSFDMYVGLESAATTLESYQPDLIPGLLQTVDYDRALVQLIWPDAEPEEWERRVALKRQRQHLVTRRNQPLTVDCVIGEAALRRIAGNYLIMGAAMRHLADMSTLPNVTIRILPFEAGYPDGLSMPPFVILGFGGAATGAPAAPPVIFLEGGVGEMYVEDEDDVKLYRSRWNNLKAAALSPEDSRRRLRDLGREYEQRER